MSPVLELQDEVLVERIRKGDEEAAELLFSRHAPMIEKEASHFFLEGSEQEDIFQEGYIGFLEAVRDFKPGKSSFERFAYYCVRKNIVDLIQKQNRKKRKAKKKPLSLDQMVSSAQESGGRVQLIDQIIYKRDLNPEAQFMMKVLVQEIVEQLTPLEKKVLRGYLDGKDAQAMATEEDMNRKSIENALQRAKTKIKEYLLAQLKG